MKATNLLVTVALMAVFAAIALAATSQPANAWLANYTYMQSFNITSPQDGALTNYQVPFTVHSLSGTSSGTDIYLNGKSWNFYDFTDIKFTDANDNLLSYYVYSNDGSTAKVYVLIPSIPAASSSVQIKVYYSSGSAEATCLSNGKTTFPILYDDFSYVNSTIWNTGSSISNGALYVDQGGSAYTKSAFAFKNHTIETAVQFGTEPDAYWGVSSYSPSSGLSAKNYYKFDYDTDYSERFQRYATADSSLATLQTASIGWSTWYTSTITQNATGTTASIGSTNIYDTTYPMVNDNAYIIFKSGTYSHIEVDYIFVRSYTAHAPTTSTWSGEQENTTYAALYSTSYVTIVLHSGYSIVYPGGTVNITSIGAQTTGSDGSTAFNLNYGRNYSLIYSLTTGGVARTGSIGFTATESKYWIDVDTGAIVPDSIASLGVSKTHECTITVYDWWNTVANVNVTLYYPDENRIVSKVTDSHGQAVFDGITDVKYKITVVNATLGINYTSYYYLPKDTAVIRVYPVTFDTILGPTGIHANLGNFSVVQNSDGFSPQSVVVSAWAYTDESGNTYIQCFYNDSSLYTTSTDYQLWTWNIGDNNSTMSLGTLTGNGNNNSVSFPVTDPYADNFEVWIIGHQTGGDVYRYFDYTWPGPMWRLPGIPIGLYQWICVAIIMAVLLGTAKWSDIGMAGITTAITTAGLWMSGWMFAWGNGFPAIITFVFVASTIVYWNQRNRMEG